MGSIHCCGARRASVSYALVPSDGYVLARVNVLNNCPVCGHYVVELLRINYLGELSRVRKANTHARKLFGKLKTSILRQIKSEPISVTAKSSFYLSYNEFGVKKRCYSNISTLKIGLFDNDDGLIRSCISPKSFVCS